MPVRSAIPHLFFALLFVVLLGARHATAADTVLTVTGPSGQAHAYTIDDLAQHAQVVVRATSEHQPEAEYTGVLLHDLLVENGAVSGKDLRGKFLADYALASAQDGYRAVFSLAELDPSVGARRVVIAYLQDGKPLSAASGPLRLVVPEEKRPARWMRQLRSVRLLSAPDER